MKNIYFIIGAPGSGKTTDAELIAKEKDDFVHYSTGELLRSEASSGSELGLKIKSFIDKGNLCPLDIVIKTVISAIKSSKEENIIMDGFPRSVEQMHKFNELLESEKDLALKIVIEAKVSKEIAMDRVLGRARGADDNEEVFENRWKVFIEPCADIKSFYEKKGIYKEVDASKDIETIVNNIQDIIAKNK